MAQWLGDRSGGMDISVGFRIEIYWTNSLSMQVSYVMFLFFLFTPCGSFDDEQYGGTIVPDSHILSDQFNKLLTHEAAWFNLKLNINSALSPHWQAVCVCVILY